MDKFAYVRGGVVCHLSASSSEEMDGTIVVPVEEGQEVNIGDQWDGDNFSVPPAAPQPATLPILSPVAFKMCFTSAERIAIKAARQSDPVLDDGYEILDDPRLSGVDLNLASVRALIDYMVGLGLLTAERALKVKAGQVL